MNAYIHRGIKNDFLQENNLRIHNSMIHRGNILIVTNMNMADISLKKKISKAIKYS